MSEEIRKRNHELNDAELAGVSGGYSEEDLEKAKRMCKQCRREQPDQCEGAGPKYLAPLINSVEYYTFCPYFEGDNG